MRSTLCLLALTTLSVAICSAQDNPFTISSPGQPTTIKTTDLDDKQDLRNDRQELNKDRNDIRNDKRDLRKDQKDLRNNKQDLTKDRVITDPDDIGPAESKKDKKGMEDTVASIKQDKKKLQDDIRKGASPPQIEHDKKDLEKDRKMLGLRTDKAKATRRLGLGRAKCNEQHPFGGCS